MVGTKRGFGAVFAGLMLLTSGGPTAATASAGAASAPVRGVVFRSVGDTHAAVARRAPMRAEVRRGASMVTPRPGRAGARKVVPVTRGQELGLRFRPDENASTGGQFPYPGGETGGSDAAQVQGPFRPIQRRRKPTYEELYQVEGYRDPLATPAGVPPYPIAPLPAPPSGVPYWPTW